MSFISNNSSLNFQRSCAERLPCGRCKLTMGMCPDNQPYTVTWTATDVNTTTTPKDVNTGDPLWESNQTVDPNSDTFKKLMC